MIKNITAKQLLDIFLKAEKAVTAKRELLNNLNVYPVPDGDTGTNMSLTLKEIIKSLDLNRDYDLPTLCEIVEESSLMGARGNSGVILSQFIGGFCEIIKLGKNIDRSTLLHAFKEGTKEAYESVSNPVEGTILTIMKSATKEMEEHQELDDLVKILKSVINRSQLTLKQTPEMLPKLKEAGVVDAGGAGFVYFLEGFYHALRENGRETLTATDDYSSPQLARIWEETFGVFGTGGLRSIIDFNYKALKFTFTNFMWLVKKAWHVIRIGKNLISVRKALRLFRNLSNQLKWQNIKRTNISILKLLQVWQETPEERYCIEAILKGVKKSKEEIKERLLEIGTSTIVAQKGKFTKIHLHTNDSKKAKSQLEKFGQIEKYKIDDIHAQHKEFIGRKLEVPKEDKGTYVIAVINGNGFKQIYESFDGVITIDGGETMNPSIAQFDQTLIKIDTNNVIIVPNNKNVFLAAQKVASKSRKNIEVLKTLDQAQGLQALLNFNKLSSITQNLEIMSNSLKLITTFSVTKATRETSISGQKIQKGDFIALTDKKVLLKEKSLDNLIQKAIEKIQVKFQLVTLYYGKSINKQEAELLKRKLAAQFRCELQIYEGGQPHYHYIVSLE